jgi:hypothetical protein
MTHLSDAELVDAAEGTVAPARAAHVEQCASCTATVGRLGATLKAAAVDRDVPEPSPLFWDHLSARVQDAIAADPRPEPAPFVWLGGIRRLAPLAAIAVIVAALWSPLSTRWRPRPDAALPGVSVAPVTSSVDHEQPLDAFDPKTSEVWDVLTAAAADLELDAAHEAGMAVQPAAIDRAVQGLNADELHELGRLLQTELRRAGN